MIEYRFRKSVLNIHWKDWCWNSNTLAIWFEELTHCKKPWCWKRLKRGEGDDRGWDGWMASATRWTWVWVSSRSCWWTGKPGVLQSMASQSRTRLRGWTDWTCTENSRLDFPIGAILPLVHCKAERSYGLRKNLTWHLKQIFYNNF